MNKTYHFEIPLHAGNKMALARSEEFDTIEECVEACKKSCKEHDVDYNDRKVKLFLTDDFGETYEECTEEGELAG